MKLMFSFGEIINDVKVIMSNVYDRQYENSGKYIGKIIKNVFNFTVN